MIYVLEDDQDIRTLETYLLKSAGYEVEAFSAGPAFEAAVAERVPELVLLDIMLPGVDGLSLLRRLRTDPRTAHVPVMLVTAKTAELEAALEAKTERWLYLTELKERIDAQKEA